MPKIIFEDTHVLVVIKPRGLLSQGDYTGEPSLVDWARLHVGRPYIGLVHRLDRETSGLMILGKRTKAAARLSEDLISGRLERRYQAWVWGDAFAKLGSREGTWTDALLKDGEKNVSRAARGDSPKTRVTRGDAKKKAITHYAILGQGELAKNRVSLMEFRLETGRSHQIRVGAATRGLPLVGDAKYGDFSAVRGAKKFTPPAEFEKNSPGVEPPLLLHSYYLEFIHPMSKAVVSITAPLSEMIMAWWAPEAILQIESKVVNRL